MLDQPQGPLRLILVNVREFAEVDAVREALTELLGADGAIVGTTEGGLARLDDLRTEGVDEEGVPSVIRVAATRARRNRSNDRFAHRVRGRSGRWMRGPMAFA